MLFGEYLRNAQGEDVVAGIRTPEKISDLQNSQPDVYAQFLAIAQQLETHYRDMQDLEFTVERGKLYMLQTRSGKRSAEAAVKIALDFVHDGLIDERTKRSARRAATLDRSFFARIDPAEHFATPAKGLNASPGARHRARSCSTPTPRPNGARRQSRDARAQRDDARRRARHDRRARAC
jgi:pyruvate,orthophosphate dikinase